MVYNCVYTHNSGVNATRTNVVLKDDLVWEAMQYTSVRSKRALIEEALQTFVAVKARYRIAWAV